MFGCYVNILKLVCILNGELQRSHIKAEYKIQPPTAAALSQNNRTLPLTQRHNMTLEFRFSRTYPMQHFLFNTGKLGGSRRQVEREHSLLHVEEDVATAVSVALDSRLLRAGDVQVVVGQPRLLLHVEHVADVVTWWARIKSNTERIYT